MPLFFVCFLFLLFTYFQFWLSIFIFTPLIRTLLLWMNLIKSVLSQFRLMFPSYTLWKYKKTRGFPMFSGDVERLVEWIKEKLKAQTCSFDWKRTSFGMFYAKFLSAFRVTLQWDGTEKPFLYFQKCTSCSF